MPPDWTGSNSVQQDHHFDQIPYFRFQASTWGRVYSTFGIHCRLLGVLAWFACSAFLPHSACLACLLGLLSLLGQLWLRSCASERSNLSANRKMSLRVPIRSLLTAGGCEHFQALTGEALSARTDAIPIARQGNLEKF